MEKHLLKTLIACASVAVAAALAASLARAEASVVIKTENSASGRHLIDGKGVSIYIFERDRRPGDQGGSNKSACSGDCLLLWPPVPSDPVPVAGQGVDAKLIGSIVRTDGKPQATYNGWPLYYFSEDFVAGDVNGHQFEEFGGDWYLVAPTGREFGGRLTVGIVSLGSDSCDCHDTDLQTVADTDAAPRDARPTALAFAK